jgi:L,D-transpeptidase ErfK/SrfK
MTAEEYVLPSETSTSVIGHLQITQARADETLLDVARRFDLGHDQIIAANPGINRWLPDTQKNILIPSLYILPLPHTSGIVINLAEFRLYFFPRDNQRVLTFPISIGDYDWRTPLGTTRIIRKVKMPTWYPPESIRREHEEAGEFLPPVIDNADPRNPLGQFALYLGFSKYLIHGTDVTRASGIGLRVSHGCIRMYPEDIEVLFHAVDVGTKVSIIHEPVKVGLKAGKIYLEYHRPQKDPFDTPLPEPEKTFSMFLSDVISRVGESVRIDQHSVLQVYQSGNGIPTAISSTHY